MLRREPAVSPVNSAMEGFREAPWCVVMLRRQPAVSPVNSAMEGFCEAPWCVVMLRREPAESVSALAREVCSRSVLSDWREDCFRRMVRVNARFFLGITTLFSFFGGVDGFGCSGSSGGRQWWLLGPLWPFHDFEAQASSVTLAEGRGGCRGPFSTRPMSQMVLCCSVDCNDCDRTARSQ